MKIIENYAKLENSQLEINFLYKGGSAEEIVKIIDK